MAIRNLIGEDIGFALSLVNKEGWNYSPEELHRMLDLDSEGSFVFEDRVPLGIATSVSYGRTGVLGHLVVSAEGRGRRIGQSLLQKAIGYLEGRGVESIVLFSTHEGVKLYERFGFRTRRIAYCMNMKVPSGRSSAHRGSCRPMGPRDVDTVARIDAEHFGDDRQSLICHLFSEFPQHSYVLERDGRIAAFAMGRKNSLCFDLGPWMCVTGRLEDAVIPFDAVLSSFGEGNVFMGAFKDNPEAVRMCMSLEKERIWETEFMVRGADRYLAGIDKVFGLLAFELG